MRAVLVRWILVLAILLPLAGGPASKAPREPVELNTATATELMQLPRVGPRIAARILEYRRTHGPFRRAEEIMNVKGIGEKAFLRLKPHIRVASRPEEAEGKGEGQEAEP